MNVDLKELAEFLVKAKKQTYAAGGREITPERPGFKELEYSEGNYNYRDSYAGFFSAPGQEIVRFGGIPIWSMAYSGGMMPQEEALKYTKFTTDNFPALCQRMKLHLLQKSVKLEYDRRNEVYYLKLYSYLNDTVHITSP